MRFLDNSHLVCKHNFKLGIQSTHIVFSVKLKCRHNAMYLPEHGPLLLCIFLLWFAIPLYVQIQLKGMQPSPHLLLIVLMSSSICLWRGRYMFNWIWFIKLSDKFWNYFTLLNRVSEMGLVVLWSWHKWTQNYTNGNIELYIPIRTYDRSITVRSILKQQIGIEFPFYIQLHFKYMLSTHFRFFISF